jgi:hypothetical protein
MLMAQVWRELQQRWLEAFARVVPEETDVPADAPAPEIRRERQVRRGARAAARSLASAGLAASAR